MQRAALCGLLVVSSLLSRSVGAQETTPAAGKVEKSAAAEKNEKKPVAAEWKNLFDGKTLDGWERSDFGGGGEVVVEEGKIVVGVTDGCNGVTWKRDFPKMDYEVSVEAMRIDGSDFFCGMTFPVGDKPCSLIVGGWGGTVVGLSSIDDKDASRNDTTKYMKFKTGQWYPIRVRVTQDRIEAWIEDKQVIDQKTKGHEISIRPEVNASKPFGIASWNTTAGLRNIKVRSLK